MSACWVGIDVAKGSFVAWIAGEAGPLGEFGNGPAGFGGLGQALAGRADVALVMEPTGGYEAALAHWALGASWTVSLVNPARVRDWARGRGRRAKTDRQDARMLADYGAEERPGPWQPVAREVEELENLLARRADLEAMLRAERNRKEALALRPRASGSAADSVERLIGALDGELGRVEEAIASLLADHARLAAGARLLEGVPGIGDRTALPVLVLLERWASLTRGRGEAKALVAYTGLDPRPHQSGTSVARRAAISRMGDRRLRHALVMAALGGVRAKGGPLGAFYRGMVGRGKAKMLALVAAARKILVWAWAVYRHQRPFSADHLGKPRPANP